ncbi:MAG: ATP-grasp domain-containing protein [Acidobacteria bacterium]|nr:ATP-grasp domain-containing protein [Acidobacteriota bacterium]
MRVLLLATTTGYQVRSFGQAAERLGVELVFATDRCHVLEDPWVDRAIPIRFHDEEASIAAILSAVADDPIAGVLVVGDQPAGIGARVAAALELPWHPPDAAAVSCNKLRMRERLRAAGENVPWFHPVSIDASPRELAGRVSYPCIVKPLVLSGSRGVIRADDPTGFVEAFERVRRLLSTTEVRATRLPGHDTILIEGYVPGVEVAIEAVMERGSLVPLAIFDKPDPLEGPFFEETIYVTPSRLPSSRQQAIVKAVARGARAMGLWHGPIHAECRIKDDAIVVLEIAARPIGGLCAESLRFDEARLKGATTGTTTASRLTPGTLAEPISLEELLLRQAIGESVAHYQRESAASGVMMMPIASAGIFRRVEGVDEARAVPAIEQIHITAKPDQKLVPLPEGASYLGFIFARAGTPEEVEHALRTAHGKLGVLMDRELTVL